jgi:predicted nucleic acid-binding protein
MVDELVSPPETVVVASDLSRMECRVKPIREGNASVLADYDHFFLEVVGERITLSAEIIDRATYVRARYGFLVPDAIHLAAALFANCDQFLTNDYSLRRFTEIPIVILARSNGDG